MRKIILWIFLFFYFFISSAYGEGLKGPAHISFFDVTIGHSHSFRELYGSNYEITNYIRDNLRIEIEPAIPRETELTSKDYEPIPDISWVKFEEKEFTLKHGESTRTDFTIAIPDEPKYLGKKFQFNIRIRMVDFPQVVAPPTKVFIAISKERLSIPRLIEELGLGELEFDLIPNEYSISNFPLGEKIDLSGFIGETFEIANLSEQKYAFRITRDADIVPGKTISGQDFLFFNTNEIVLEAHERKRFHPYLLIPNKEIYRGREFVFVIRVQVAGQIPEQYRSSIITIRTKGE